MKDEIKEILNYILSRTIDDCLLDGYFSKLEDYITNLQERIDKAIEYCNNIMFETKREEKIQDDLLNILQGEDTKESEVK